MSKGFGVALSPKQQIKNFRRNTPALTPQNIGIHVQTMRDQWNGDYGKRCASKATSIDKVMEVREPEVVVFSDWVIENKKMMGMKMHFCAHYGHWSLLLYTMPNGDKEWSINVSNGYTNTWHPTEAKNPLVKFHGEEVYHQWKRQVMSEYDEAIVWLMKEAKKACPGYTSWSITASESSARLMKRTPNVHVVSGVAFLFL